MTNFWFLIIIQIQSESHIQIILTYTNRSGIIIEPREERNQNSFGFLARIAKSYGEYIEYSHIFS